MQDYQDEYDFTPDELTENSCPNCGYELIQDWENVGFDEQGAEHIEIEWVCKHCGYIE